MNVETLIKMANQICTLFEPEVAIETAAADTASHLKRFWDPRERHALIQHVDAYGDEELLPVVRSAGSQSHRAARRQAEHRRGRTMEGACRGWGCGLKGLRE